MTTHRLDLQAKYQNIGIKESQQEAKSFVTTLKSVETQVRKNNQALETHTRRLKNVSAYYSAVKTKLDSVDQAQKRIVGNISNLDKMNTTVKKAANSFNSFGKQVDNSTVANQKAKTVINEFNRSLKNLMVRFSAFILLMGTYRAAMNIVGEGAQFEKSMTAVRGVARATASEYAKLTAKAREMGATTEWTATQAAEAEKYLAMAGLNVLEVSKALRPTLDIATGGMIGLAEAADLTTNIMTGMKIPVENLTGVNDVLIGTITRTNSSITELAESFKYVAPTAQTFGYDIQQTSAYLGMLHNAGLKGSLAGTNLSRAMLGVDKVLRSMGKSAKDAQGNTYSLTDAMKMVNDAGWSTSKVMQTVGLVGGRAFLILKQNIPYLEALEKQLRNVEGESKALADKMRGTLAVAFDVLKSKITDIKLDFMAKHTQYLRESIVSLGAAIEKNKKNIESWIEKSIEMLKFLAIMASMKGLITIVVSLASAIRGLTVATAGLTLAMKANLIVLGLTAIAYSVLKYREYIKNIEAEKKMLEQSKNAREDVNKVLGEYLKLRDEEKKIQASMVIDEKITQLTSIVEANKKLIQENDKLIESQKKVVEADKIREQQTFSLARTIPKSNSRISGDQLQVLLDKQKALVEATKQYEDALKTLTTIREKDKAADEAALEAAKAQLVKLGNEVMTLTEKYKSLNKSLEESYAMTGNPEYMAKALEWESILLEEKKQKTIEYLKAANVSEEKATELAIRFKISAMTAMYMELAKKREAYLKEEDHLYEDLNKKIEHTAATANVGSDLDKKLNEVKEKYYKLEQEIFDKRKELRTRIAGLQESLNTEMDAGSKAMIDDQIAALTEYLGKLKESRQRLVDIKHEELDNTRLAYVTELGDKYDSLSDKLAKLSGANTDYLTQTGKKITQMQVSFNALKSSVTSIISSLEEVKGTSGLASLYGTPQFTPVQKEANEKLNIYKQLLLEIEKAEKRVVTQLQLENSLQYQINRQAKQRAGERSLMGLEKTSGTSAPTSSNTWLPTGDYWVQAMKNVNNIYDFQKKSLEGLGADQEALDELEKQRQLEIAKIKEDYLDYEKQKQIEIYAIAKDVLTTMVEAAVTGGNIGAAVLSSLKEAVVQASTIAGTQAIGGLAGGAIGGAVGAGAVTFLASKFNLLGDSSEKTASVADQLAQEFSNLQKTMEDFDEKLRKGAMSYSEQADAYKEGLASITSSQSQRSRLQGTLSNLWQEYYRTNAGTDIENQANGSRSLSQIMQDIKDTIAQINELSSSINGTTSDIESFREAILQLGQDSMKQVADQQAASEKFYQDRTRSNWGIGQWRTQHTSDVTNVNTQLDALTALQRTYDANLASGVAEDTESMKSLLVDIALQQNAYAQAVAAAWESEKSLVAARDAAIREGESARQAMKSIEQSKAQYRQNLVRGDWTSTQWETQHTNDFNDAQTQLVALQASIREYAKALSDGTSANEESMQTLAVTISQQQQTYTEALQREWDSEQGLIDAKKKEIESVNDTIKANEDLISSNQGLIDANIALAKTVSDQRNDLIRGSLNPNQSFAMAQQTYQGLYLTATSTNATDADVKAFQDYVNTYLEKAQQEFKSTGGYEEIFGQVTDDLSALKETILGRNNSLQDTNASLIAANNVLNSTVSGLTTTLTTILDTSITGLDTSVTTAGNDVSDLSNGIDNLADIIQALIDNGIPTYDGSTGDNTSSSAASTPGAAVTPAAATPTAATVTEATSTVAAATDPHAGMVWNDYLGMWIYPRGNGSSIPDYASASDYGSYNGGSSSAGYGSDYGNYGYSSYGTYAYGDYSSGSAYGYGYSSGYDGYDEGGIVDAPSTGKPVIVHNQEGIVPLKNGSIPVTITHKGSDNEDTNNLLIELIAAVKANGGIQVDGNEFKKVIKRVSNEATVEAYNQGRLGQRQGY
jgi:TP901 family phage tail tape measure protein